MTHFEIYGEKPAELADFYRSLFGWQIEQMPGVDYWRIRTEGPNNGSFCGGLTHRAISHPHSWIQYVNVVSIDEALTQAGRLGGTILRPKTAVPKTGWCAILADPEGNVFAVWQPDPTAFPMPEPD